MSKVKANANESTGVQTTELDSIQLKDGTVLNLPLNGTEYESTEKIEPLVLSEDNLSEVIINGENRGRMLLVSYYDYNGGTRFTIREPNAEEIAKIQQAKTNTDMELALTEVYEMLLGMM